MIPMLLEMKIPMTTLKIMQMQQKQKREAAAAPTILRSTGPSLLVYQK